MTSVYSMAHAVALPTFRLSQCYTGTHNRRSTCTHHANDSPSKSLPVS
ncbi:hypothetical protein PF008_g30945 [Phytophthora fragariae]|uniref:Uncharacterized protein n=1 Tax=Phytophthora fragariae TaxID=53985 RepID=A0A6G0Q463_9STRA|nr:hypothetical protein PF008_g30945 [Phytophthora fragariae]